MPVGACFGIDEEAVEQSESQCERAMIRRDVLRLAALKSRRFARAEDCKPRVAICGRAIARTFEVSEYLIIGPILFDDIYDVLEGGLALKQAGAAFAYQPVISHNLLSVSGKLALSRLICDIYIA